MPTGYTADLYDDKPVTFEDFVLTCARAFGAFMYQRDSDRKDAPKLLEYDPDNWNEQGLKKAFAKVERLKKMSPEDIDREYLAYVSEKTEYARDTERNRAAMRVRYEQMLRQVQDWDVSGAKGTLVVNLKKFMVEQLEQSIEHDTSPMRYAPTMYNSAMEWYNEEVAHAKHDLVYHKQKIEEEKVRVQKQNVEALELYNFLGLPTPKDKIKA